MKLHLSSPVAPGSYENKSAQNMCKFSWESSCQEYGTKYHLTGYTSSAFLTRVEFINPSAGKVTHYTSVCCRAFQPSRSCPMGYKACITITSLRRVQPPIRCRFAAAAVGVWVVNLLEISELLLVKLVDLVINHGTNRKVPGNVLEQNERRHDDRYCTFDWCDDCCLIEEQKENKRWLQQQRQ